MGHLATAYQCEAGAFRQSQNVFEPAASNLFNDPCGRAACVESRILVPCRCEPIGGQGRWKRPSDRPTPKASACRA